MRYLLFVCIGVVICLASWIGISRLKTSEPVKLQLTRNEAIDFSKSGGLGNRTNKTELAEFDPVVIVSQPFPSITEIPIRTASEVDDVLQEDDLVLGVSINGQSRAYPVSALDSPPREIINDEIGNTPIAVTW